MWRNRDRMPTKRVPIMVHKKMIPNEIRMSIWAETWSTHIPNYVWTLLIPFWIFFTTYGIQKGPIGPLGAVLGILAAVPIRWLLVSSLRSAPMSSLSTFPSAQQAPGLHVLICSNCCADENIFCTNISHATSRQKGLQKEACWPRSFCVPRLFGLSVGL